jgi:hypothetical protein
MRIALRPKGCGADVLALSRGRFLRDPAETLSLICRKKTKERLTWTSRHFSIIVSNASNGGLLATNEGNRIFRTYPNARRAFFKPHETGGVED